MIGFSRICIPRVYENFPVLIGRLIHTSGEHFYDLAQLNDALAGSVLKRLYEVNASWVLRVLLYREGDRILLWFEYVP